MNVDGFDNDVCVFVVSCEVNSCERHRHSFVADMRTEEQRLASLLFAKHPPSSGHVEINGEKLQGDGSVALKLSA